MATGLEALELRISANAQDAAKGLDALIQSLSNLSDALVKPYSDLRDFNEQLKELKKMSKIKISIEGTQSYRSVEKTTNAITKQAEAVKTLGQETRTIGITNGLGFQKGYETEAERMAKNPQWYQNPVEQARQAQEYLKEHGGVASWTEEAQKATKIFNDLTETMNRQTNVAKTQSSIIHKVSSAFKAVSKSAKESASEVDKSGSSIGKSLKTMFSGVIGFFNRVKRIAITMMIRKAIRGLISAIKEGVNNLKEWSKVTNKVFYNDMLSAKANVLTLKNSLGAALAPMIQALIPLFKRLSSAVINAANWINQFISLLSGKTSWTRAVEQNAEDVEDAANKTAGAAKEMLAAFDELNVISSGSGGGGGASSTIDYGGMFEEITEFDEKIKGIAEFVKRNLEDIKGLAVDAGAALLAWKISKAFSGALSEAAAIVAAIEIIRITWKMTAMFDNQYIDTGDEGWLVTDVVTNAVGATLAGEIVEGILGAGSGLATAGFTLMVSGGISYGIAAANAESDNAETLKQIGIIKGVIGDLLIGAGFAVATESVAAGVAAALIAPPLFYAAAAITYTIVKAQKEQEIADEFFSQAGEGGVDVKKLFDILQKMFDDAAEPYKITIDAFKERDELLTQIEDSARVIRSLNSVVTSGDMLTQEQANQFKEAWTTVFDSFEKANTIEWNTIFDGFNSAINVQNETLKEQAKEARITALQIKEGLSTVEAELVDRMNELVDKIITNTATTEEIEEYKQKMQAFATISDSATDNFNKVINGIGTIDFSDANNSVNAATEFIRNVTTSYNEVAASIDQGLAAQLEAIETQKERINSYVEAGLLTPEQALEWSSSLDSFAKTFTETAAQKKDELASQMENAFTMVLQTAKEGIKNYISGDGTIDFEGASTYVDTVIKPIVNAIKESDVDVNEALKQAFTFSEDLSDYLDYDTLQELMNFITGEIGEAAAEAGKTINLGDSFIQNAFNLVNWDIDDANKQYISNQLIEAFGMDAAIASLKDYFNLDVSEFFQFTGWKDWSTTQQLQFMKAMTDAYGSEEALAAAKQAGMDVSALISYGMRSSDSEIVEVAKQWAKDISDNVADEDTAKSAGKKCIQGIDKGIKEETSSATGGLSGFKAKILEFAKDPTPGKEAGKAFSDGMHDKTAAVAEKAKEWKSGIEGEVSNINVTGNVKAALTYDKAKATTTAKNIAAIATAEKPRQKIFLTYDKDTAKTTAGKIAKIATDQKPKMIAALDYNAKNAESKINDLKSKVTNTTAKLSVKGEVVNTDSIISAIKKLNATVNVNGTISSGFVSSVSGGIVNGIKSALNGRRFSINDKGNGNGVIAIYGTGGVVRSGQMFIARENGIPEMVGSIGNTTTVANNDQIVAGIEGGVARANAEQNALLRRQNEILLGILAKDVNVNIGASSGFGRTVKRSLEMYNAVGG